MEGAALASVDVFVRVARLDGTVSTALLGVGRDVFEWVGPAAGGGYLWLGVEHIWFGADHLLFVFGFVLLVADPRRLAGAVTGFTVGHSLTLAAASLGALSLPQAPVEAAIAASILLLAVELTRDGGLARRRPWAVAGAFGLLHGFGFAGALASLGLPASGRVGALLAFNVGVELGQLAFVALVLVGARLVPWIASLRPLAVYSMGTLATFWLLERVAAFPL